MKAITLTQPWATLVAIGEKKIETRSWNTKYRGPLAIHAAKGFPKDAQHICFNVPFRDCLGDYIALNETYVGQHRFPLGAIIATCELISTHKVDDMDWFPGKRGWMSCGFYWEATAQEKSFGDYSIGRYMWFLANVKILEKPLPVRGALGLWEWDDYWNENISMRGE